MVRPSTPWNEELQGLRGQGTRAVQDSLRLKKEMIVHECTVVNPVLYMKALVVLIVYYLLRKKALRVWTEGCDGTT